MIEITPTDVVIEGPDGGYASPPDAVLLLTGYRSDTTLLRHGRRRIDESTGAPVHDPDTFETTVPNLFVAGACVAGKQSGRIFIENGRFHGEVVDSRNREAAADRRRGDGTDTATLVSATVLRLASSW